MNGFLILLAVALLGSAIGFKKYVWFMSIGYGGAIAAIGIALMIMFRGSMTGGTRFLAILFILYGIRLAGYLGNRELRSRSYNKKIQGEIMDDSKVSMPVKFAIWVFVSLLYVCETAPVLFRLQVGKGTDFFVVFGIIIMILGLGIETLADLQKNAAKKRNPQRFVSGGLYRIVRCPNYFGEILFWTGVLFTGLNVCHTPLQWICVLVGYIILVYVMFGGARRLEMRQNKNYGIDRRYQRYVKNVPIIIPFVPLFSLESFKWLIV